MECHSLKDWLKNDEKFLKYSGREIEDFVTKTRSLAICADFANGKKHFVCDPHRTGREEFRSGAKPSLIYYLEVARSCEDGDDNAVSPGGRGGRESIDCQHADQICNSWCRIGVDPQSIRIYLRASVFHDGKIIEFEHGLASLAWEAFEAWREFTGE